MITPSHAGLHRLLHCAQTVSRSFTCSGVWHDRRRIVTHVTALVGEMDGQQLREAFPFDQLPRYLLRDRDAIFGDDFQDRCETWISRKYSARRDPLGRALCGTGNWFPSARVLDHVIVFHESSLRRTLASYFDYYHDRDASLVGEGLARATTHQPLRWGQSWQCRRSWIASPLRTTGAEKPDHRPRSRPGVL